MQKKKKLATKQIFRLFNLIADLEYKSRKKCVNRIIGCLKILMVQSKYLSVYLKKNHITDNPAYFYTSDSPKSPELTSKKFTFFRRRSSSNHKLILTKSENYTQTFETSSKKNSNKNKLIDSDSEVTIRNVSIAEPCGADNENFIYGKFRQRLGSCNDSVFYSDKSECTKPLNRYFI